MFRMKAVQINKYGGYDVLEVNENATKPKTGEEQVLVEVYAVSINPFDYKVRSGMYKNMMPLKFPSTVGGDFAGVVKEVRGEFLKLLKVFLKDFLPCFRVLTCRGCFQFFKIEFCFFDCGNVCLAISLFGPDEYYYFYAT